MTANQFGATIFALLAAFLWGLAPVAGKLGLASTDPGTALVIRTSGVAAILFVYVLATGGLAHVAAVGWRPAAFLIVVGVLLIKG